MAYKIVVQGTFRDDLRSIDQSSALRVLAKIDQLARNPTMRSCKPLRNLPKAFRGLHSLRVGEYRALLWLDHRKQEITLYAVAHRREVYGKLG